MIEPPSEDEAAVEARPAPLGLFRFTIEGRHAPGLFVAGWVAAIVGGSTAFVALLAGPGLTGLLLFILGLALVFLGLVLLGGSQAIERRHAGHAYAGPSPILTVAVVAAGWYLAARVVLTPLVLVGADISGPSLVLLGEAIKAFVVVAVLGLMVVGSGALSWSDMGVRRPDRAALRAFAWGAVLAAPVIAASAIVAWALVSLTGQQPVSPLPPTGSPGGLVLNILAAVVLAPVSEELFFRGFTLTAWRRMNGPVQAIVRSGILFALIHAIDQTGDTFGAALGVAIVAAGARVPVALALGWVFQRQGSLWASIGLHATFNGVLLILAERLVAA